VPVRVRALATTRLAHLDQTARRVLELAAVATRAVVSLDELRAGAASLEPLVSEPALLDALDRALDTRLLEERAGGYAFRHPLVRCALYEGLSRHRREQLHAALSRTRPESHPQLTISSAR
jgi:predicted ATPase